MQSTILSRLTEAVNKNSTAREVLKCIAVKGCLSVGEISEECSISYPTANKLIDSLVQDEILHDLGRRHKEGGRMPVKYGFNPRAGYFLGIIVADKATLIGIMDFSGTLVFNDFKTKHFLSEEGDPDALCNYINDILKDSGISKSKIMACTICLPGRVRMDTGESLNYFIKQGSALSRTIGEKIGVPNVYVENDSRIMCYGEYVAGGMTDYKNMIYVNFRWGLGIGMILNGRLFYGATGIAGELGHMFCFNNEIFCRCGKKGCLETEASGLAIERLLKQKHAAGARSLLSPKLEKGESLLLQDFVDATKEEDMLMIEIVEEVGTKLGMGLSGLINILNPEVVVLGGMLADLKDYILLPTISAIRKYSLNVVSRDTKIITGKIDNPATIGACLFARDKMLGMI